MLGKKYNAEITKIMPQHYFASLPPGNYSGMSNIGNNDYAVVSDKGEQGGYYIFHIDINDNGEITNITNKDFVAISDRNMDEEAIAFNPVSRHIYIGNEETSGIIDYDIDKKEIVGSTVISDFKQHCVPNRNIESLTYDATRNKLFTINESPLIGDSCRMLRLKMLNTDLVEECEYPYFIEQPIKSTDAPADRHAYGVSELLSLNDSTLLVLERELYITSMKLGSWVHNSIFRITPGKNGKQLVCSWRTSLQPMNFGFANYEGMCLGPKLSNGRQVIILCADSQNRYKGVLKDYFKTIIL
jgi:hypothetical protein